MDRVLQDISVKTAIATNLALVCLCIRMYISAALDSCINVAFIEGLFCTQYTVIVI